MTARAARRVAEFCGVCGEWKCEGHADSDAGLRLVGDRLVPPPEAVAWLHPLVVASRARCRHGFVIAESRWPEGLAWAGAVGFCRCCLTGFGYVAFGPGPDPWLCGSCGGRELGRYEHIPTCGLPRGLARILRDPTITVSRDNEITLADGRSLLEHIREWQNAPSNTASGGCCS